MDTLATIVKNDISSFLERNKELLFNERDFQMHLATYLRNTKKYDDVDVEYYVPFAELDNYILENEFRIYIDIVVRKAEEYLPVELKYKTKKVEQKISCFGEELKQKCEVMKNQGAQDIGKYGFWKDVSRVELVRKRFKSIKNGIAVFLTNDNYYLKSGREDSNCIQFSMTEGVHKRDKYWLNPESRCAKDNKNFSVEKDYSISWKNVSFYIGSEKHDFYYCIVII